MSSDLAIKVDSLSKCYQIYDTPRDRLKQFVLPQIQRVMARTARQYYREFWALKEVSFEIKKGETVGIIGRNGSGKSTLLQMISGTLDPSSGSAKVNGRLAALLELGSGFNPEFTGRENAYMNAVLLGLTTDVIDARFNDILAFADIGEFIDQPVRTYSSGMVVRLAFAVIAHVDADILVIDEALAVGDAAFARKCTRFLREFMEYGTVLFVSHDTAAIRSLCNRAVWLDHGRLMADGDPKSTSEAYLKHLYEAQQGTGVIRPASSPSTAAPKAVVVADARQAFLAGSNLRNDLQVFEMSPGAAGFGKGGVEIVRVSLQNDCGASLAWAVGGEFVNLLIEAIAREKLEQVIVGFVFKDKLGQYLFGDNTYLTYMDNPIALQQGNRFVAKFRFMMPILRAGDYCVDIAVADGTQRDHLQQLWLHDALQIKSVSSSVCTGLVGIPMDKISLTVQ